jgi:hypothetical protein
MAQMIVRVKGTYALLTHNPAGMVGTKTARGQTKIPTPEEEATIGCYRDEEGNFALPGMAFRNSILAASSGYKQGKIFVQSKITSMMVLDELVTLINDDDSPVASYEIDTRRALVQGNGIMRSRPKFNPWGARFTIEYDETLFDDEDMLRTIIADAGKRIGVGDYRPQKLKSKGSGLPGPFGRYALVDEVVSSARPIITRRAA